MLKGNKLHFIDHPAVKYFKLVRSKGKEVGEEKKGAGRGVGDNPEIHVTGALWLKSEIQADLPSKDPNIYKKKPYNILSAIKEKKRNTAQKTTTRKKKIYMLLILPWVFSNRMSITLRSNKNTFSLNQFIQKKALQNIFLIKKKALRLSICFYVMEKKNPQIIYAYNYSSKHLT